MHAGLIVGWMGTFLSRFGMINFRKALLNTANLLRTSAFSRTITLNILAKGPGIVQKIWIHSSTKS